MMLADLVLPTYTQMLQRLADWLAKAASERGDTAEALLSARLAPDMFPLSTQVRFACVQAFEGVCRLRGEAFPPDVAVLLAEGRDGATAPGTLAEAQARIAQTLEMLAGVDPATLEGDPAAPLEHRLPMGLVLDFEAGQYARDWTLAQFYFHIMTAYAILRSEGVTLGKIDYVTHLLPFARPGTMPGA